MSYQTLYSMPCRLPCQRYANFDARVQIVNEKFDGGEYEPTISRENYEYEPTVATEMYADVAENGAKCNCEPLNRPYRMESCGYNQSPTWDYHRSFSAENFEAGAEEQANCKCSPNNPPYRMERCQYNQSPTWTDQATFRNTLQDRPF